MKLSFLVSCAVCFASLAVGEVRLPSIVGDGMVLQRNAQLKIWGWAAPGEAVSVTFGDESGKTVAGSDGKWLLKLGPRQAGGPYQMKIQGTNTIELKDILVGDVWVCSGQSNMTHYLGRHSERYAKEIAAAENPRIRQFRVPTTAVLEGPLEDIEGLQWKAANPETVLDFTVIGYFFAKKLQEKYDVPMGLIMTCVGGTKIEAWTSEEGFDRFPETLESIERNKDAEYVNRVNAEARADREADGPKAESDRGLTDPVKWFDPAHVPLNWKSYNIPGYWEDQGVRNLDGVVWFRREVEIPESMTGVEAMVKLGRIRNADDLYINGEKVGGTTYEYPQREYKLAAGVLKAGKNLFVVRVRNDGGKGGFIPDKPYHISAAGQTVDLKGEWQFKVGEAFRPSRSYKQGVSAQSEPTSLYNGMIAPFINYGVRGLLWYQGESNAGDPEAYAKLLPNLAKDWRSKWQLGELPFLIAQLPNYMDVDYLPAESSWARMREVQLKTSQSLPNCGLGVNIDLGEWNDIHPGNKKPVGERLALQAMAISYGDKSTVVSGPIYNSLRIDDDEIVLAFDHVGSGLVSSNGEALGHFAIAGADKAFVWGNAVIRGDEVVVSSPEISHPKYVRYAWADNPDFANLANKEGLPASPFRTDK